MPTRSGRSSRRTTLWWAAGFGALLAAVWVTATLLAPDQQPRTVEAAAAEVTAHLDRIEGTLPNGSIVDRSEEVTHDPCPLEGRGAQAKILRVVHIDPALDRVKWASALGDEFPEADGWVINVEENGDSRGDLDIRVVGRDLVIVDVVARGDDEQARITMRSTSECSRLD